MMAYQKNNVLINSVLSTILYGYGSNFLNFKTKNTNVQQNISGTFLFLI